MSAVYSVVGSDGQVYGPVDMATLQQWITEGRIVPTTELIDPLDGSRLLAAQAPALMGRFPDQAAYPRPGMSTPHSPYPDAYPASYDAPRKSKLTAILLAIFLGSLGVHRFYLGHVATGLAMLALSVISFIVFHSTRSLVGIWILVDIVLLVVGKLRDSYGRRLNP